MPKKFIDKKKATTYKLVYRSQDDPLAFEEGASDRVFVEVGKSGQLKNKGKVLDPDQTMEQSLRDLNLDDIPEEDLDEPRDAGQAALYGVYLDDRDYDYTKHLRKVGSGGGVMLEAPGAKKEQAAGIQFTDDGETVAGSSKFAMPAELLPSQHHMDIKAEAFPTGLQPNMNPNLREALEALEDEDVEEFDDDFFDQLNSDQAPEGAEMEDEYDEFQDDEDFDPDDVFAHVRRLKAQRKYDSDSEPEYSDDEREAASDFSMSSSAMFRNDKLSLLDDQFDAVEAMYEREESDSEDERYDSDGHGIVEYDSDGNVKSISTRPDFQNVMEEFLSEFELTGKRLQVKLEGGDGAGKLSTVRNAMLKEGQGVDESRKELLEKGLEMIEEANERAANDDYADLDAQFQEKQRVPWDCQTILTTYSTLDNHPATIHEKRAPRIKVSRKTGFPMVENPDEENEKKEEEEEEEQEERINKGEARSKGETKEEKRLRKQQLKEAKRDRREQKRETQGVFAEKRDRKMQSRKDRAQYVIHMD